MHFNSRFVISSAAQIPACNNCCSNKTYTEISNPRRSTKSSWNKGENALCDRDLPSGWYRFTSFAGGKIPERMVAQDHCGTRAPVWLNGRHPTKKGQNVVRQACVNKLDLNNGCWEFFDINIMNCGDYFVYYLQPPSYCSVAYCAGKQCNKFRFMIVSNGQVSYLFHPLIYFTEIILTGYMKPCPYGQEGEPPNCVGTLHMQDVG